MKKKITIGTVIIATILLIPSIMSVTVDSPGKLFNSDKSHIYVNTIENSEDYQAQGKLDTHQISEIPVFLQDIQPILKITDIKSILNPVSSCIIFVASIALLTFLNDAVANGYMS